MSKSFSKNKQQLLLDIVRYIDELDVQNLSNIPNIIKILNIIKKKDPSFANKIDELIPQIDQKQISDKIPNIEFTKEDEDFLNKLGERQVPLEDAVNLDDIDLEDVSQEENSSDSLDSQSTPLDNEVKQSERQIPLEDAVNLDDIKLEDVSNTMFLTLLQSMIDKLPPSLGEQTIKKEGSEGVNSAEYVVPLEDKEFCYKFLYSMKNNPANKNPRTNKIYNNIIDYYGIGEPQVPLEDLTNKKEGSKGNVVPLEIDFEDGLVISVVVAPTKGGTTTQKRRKYKRKKYTNYTIKGR
jgi:hypothetical protein